MALLFALIINYGGAVTSKVNTSLLLDPDFGSIVPTVDCAYWVKVLPEDGAEGFDFVLLMPTITDLENEEEFLGVACAQLLTEWDAEVQISPISDDDYAEVTKSTLVACFNPDHPEEFVWITPPMLLRN